MDLGIWDARHRDRWSGGSPLAEAAKEEFAHAAELRAPDDQEASHFPDLGQKVIGPRPIVDTSREFNTRVHIKCASALVQPWGVDALLLIGRLP